MPIPDQHIRIADLLMGRSTNYRWLTETNPLEVLTRSNGGGMRPNNHGSYGGAELLDEKVIVVEFLIDCETESEALAALDVAAAAFGPVGLTGPEKEFEYNWAGHARLLFGRPRGLTPRLEHKAAGKIFCRGGFAALNPLRYDATESVIGPITPPTFVGGLRMSLQFPMRFAGSLAGGEQDIVNAGTIETGLMLRINGPCIDPQVILLDDDDVEVSRMSVETAVAAGHWLDIDTASRTVFGDDVTNLRTSFRGVWTKLPPGAHKIQYRASQAAGSSLTGTFRSAWI